MPINRLIKDGKVDTETGAVLNRAFERALRELGLLNQKDAVTKIVAEKIVEVGATSTSDPDEIAKAVIKRLNLPDAR